MLYRFAITRKPGINFSQGITTGGLGQPDYPKAAAQHQMYVSTLKSCGLEVIVLDPDLQFPDGCFVEDTAILTDQMAVITNPGAVTRRGEAKTIAEALKPFRDLYFIESPGTLEGGDVLKAEDKFFVGLSERTNSEGFRQFENIVRQFGYCAVAVRLENILHLKSGIGYTGNNRMVAVRELARRDEFQAYEMAELEGDENYAANCLRVDSNKLIIPKGFQRIRQTLIRQGNTVIEIEMTEFQKMDGGLTCLSLLFR